MSQIILRSQLQTHHPLYLSIYYWKIHVEKKAGKILEKQSGVPREALQGNSCNFRKNKGGMYLCLLFFFLKFFAFYFCSIQVGIFLQHFLKLNSTRNALYTQDKHFT